MEKTIKVAEKEGFHFLGGTPTAGVLLAIIMTFLMSFFIFDLTYYPDWILELPVSKITVIAILIIITYIIKRILDAYNLSKLTLLKRSDREAFSRELERNITIYNGENTTTLVICVSMILFFGLLAQAILDKNIFVEKFNNNHAIYEKCIYVYDNVYNGKVYKGNVCINADYVKKETYGKTYSELKGYIKSNIIDDVNGGDIKGRNIIEYIYKNKDKANNNIITVINDTEKIITVDFSDLIVVGENLKF